MCVCMRANQALSVHFFCFISFGKLLGENEIFSTEIRILSGNEPAFGYESLKAKEV